MKKNNKKISMITAYDYTTAKIISDTNIDWVLVGDSAAMTMHGHNSTPEISVDEMISHTQAVCKGISDKLIIGDIPLKAFNENILEVVNRFIKAGANAVKLEGVDGFEDIIKQIVDKDIKVMGHLGLTPQTIDISSGNVVQARDESSAEKLIADAKKLEQLGCFAIVLECIPAKLASQVSQEINIPTIGIGAGIGCDGQGLVIQDMLGMNDNKFKFVKKYLNGQKLISDALNEFDKDVKEQKFPTEENSFK